jgi:DNA repair exonuclease SbcCD nuclease subunit
MKIAIIGDVHIKPDNIPDIRLFHSRLLLELEKYKLDFIVVLGDILHSHENLHTEALNQANILVESLRKISKVYLLVGNHDMINNSQFLTSNHWMNVFKEWENVVVVDNVVETTVRNESTIRKFVFVPYVPNGRFREALNTLETPYDDSTIIFAHQEFKGVKMGAITSVHGDEWDEKDPFVVSGHIHSHQLLGTNILYTGSSLQNAYGESENNYLFVYNNNDSNNGVVSERDFIKVDLDLPRKVIVYSTIENIESTIKNTVSSNKKTKISISGTAEEFTAFKKSKGYSDAVASGVVIVHKPTRKEKGERTKLLEGTRVGSDCIGFNAILYDLIKNDKSEYGQMMSDMYTSIIK